jgi:hypothetical protein
MKFKVVTKDLVDTINLVSIVTPAPKEGAVGFLCVVRGDRCYIYSSDDKHSVRGDVQISDVDGSGSFVFPAGKVDVLKYTSGWIELNATQEDDKHLLSFVTEGGAEGDLPTFDPSYLTAIDENLEAAKEAFQCSAGVLREALNFAKAYPVKPNELKSPEKGHLQSVRIFGADAGAKNGCLFGTDQTRICYFWSEAFVDKDLSIHSQDMGLLTSFLSKCEGNITVRVGSNATYAVNSKGQVLGWPHQVQQHPKFSYYNRETDKFVLRTPKDKIVKALMCVKAALEVKGDKVRVTYSHSTKALKFHVDGAGKISSEPVFVDPLPEGADAATTDLAFNANLHQLLELFEGARGNDVTLRVALPERAGKSVALMRTIEEFYLSSSGKVMAGPEDGKESFRCETTRYCPQKS